MLSLYSLEQHIEAQMKAARIPGLALAIVKDQEVIYAKGFGVTSVEDGGLPVTPQTLFRIGSTTKPLTGTAVMRLVEDGKLNLDRPVREYVDWLTFSEEGAIDRVTLRMLMSHTAGLPTAADIKDGCLYVDFTFFHQKLSCTPLDNTRFVCERGLIEFQMADDGAVSTLIWGKSFTFTRVHEM